MNPTQPSVGEDPGKTLGIVSLITAILGISLVGLITGIIGMKKSKAAGYKNTLALIGTILSAIGLVVGTILLIVFAAAIGSIASKCAELGPGVHKEGATTITCGDAASAE